MDKDIYIYTYIYNCIHMNIFLYIHMYIHIYIHTYIYAYMYIYISTHEYTYINIYENIYICIYIYMYIYIEPPAQVWHRATGEERRRDYGQFEQCPSLPPPPPQSCVRPRAIFAPHQFPFALKSALICPVWLYVGTYECFNMYIHMCKYVYKYIYICIYI